MQQSYGTGQAPYQQFGQQPPQNYGTTQGYPPAPAPHVPTSSPPINQAQWAPHYQATPQSWGQQAPGQSYGAPTQNTSYQQTGQQGGYSQQSSIQASPPVMQQQQQPYNPAAPPPPSATPGGSYFPPAPGRTNSGSFPPTPGSMNMSSPPPVLSPNEQQPAYVPPSLSGQGVAAYMPSNTNPLPGVYVPPPPDIPAWTHAQSAGFSGQNKKFKYTKPIVHPSYQTAAQGYGGMAAGMPQAPQVPPTVPQSYNSPAQHQMPPPQQHYSAPGPPQMPLAQQQQQSFQQYPSNPQQPPPQHYQQSPPPPQPHKSSQTQPQYPPPNAPQIFGSPSLSQQQPQAPFAPQPYAAPQMPGQQNWQVQGQPDFAHGSSYAPQQAESEQQSFQAPSPAPTQPQAPQRFEHTAAEQDPHFQPVSPLQPGASISSGQAIEQRERQPSLSVSRKPVRSSSTASSIAAAEGLRSSATSALGRGEPSDWEHFASGEDLIDSAARSSISAGRPVSPQQLDRYELPSQSSPPLPVRRHRESSDINLSQEQWPQSPAPAPLNVIRSPSGFQQNTSAPLPNDRPQGVVSIDAASTKSMRAQSPQPPLTTTKSPSPISSAIPQAVVADPVQHPQQPPQPADLISDLDPWYVGSLERYIAMLRLEANTASVEDKIQVFALFIKAESQVRGIDLAAMFQPIPAAMPTDEAPLPQSVQASNSQSIPTATQELPHRPALTSPVPSSDYVIVEQMTQEEYSPGGRPIMSRRLTKGQAAQPNIDIQAAQLEGSTPLAERKPSANTERQNEYPTLTEVAPTSSPYKAFRSGTGPNVGEPSTQSIILTPTTSASGEDFPRNASEQKHSTAQPVYKPYTGGTESMPRFDAELSATRPPLSHHGSSTASWRRQGEIFFEEEPPANTFFGKPESKETFPAEEPSDLSGFYQPFAGAFQAEQEDIGSEDGPPPISTFGAQTAQHPVTVSQTPSRERSPIIAPSPQESPSQALLKLLPPAIVQNPPSHPRLSAIEASASKLPSDYSFITSLASTWEAGARQTRSRLDAERRQRQEETEARNEELYNDNEIDYAEMNQLDEDFRVQEVAKQAQEGKDEYQSYVKGVFDVVCDRLQQEIRALMSFFAEVEALLAEQAVGGISALSPPEERKEVAPTIVQGLEVLLMLHKKIEEHHARVAEAVADRDKRYKRTETAPLYAMNKIAQMKQVEKHYEQTEKQAALRVAGECEERVRRLMEIVDEAARKGVGDNQDDADKILELVQKIGAEEGTQDNPKRAEALERAKEVARALAQSSKALMRYFHTVEVEMNDAEYASEVAKAKAKADGANKEAFGRLEAQKATEDAKLDQEFQSRIKMNDEDLTDAESIIAEVEKGKGKPRMAKALEDAKRRNGELA